MGQALKILIADDDKSFRDELMLALSLRGYEVRGAGNGALAMRSLEDFAADILLTDWLMPEMDGIELIRAVQVRWPNTKIVAISSGGSMDWPTLARTAGAFGVHQVLQKPVNIGDLIQTIGK